MMKQIKKCPQCLFGTWVVGLGALTLGALLAASRSINTSSLWLRGFAGFVALISVFFLIYQPPFQSCPKCLEANRRAIAETRLPKPKKVLAVVTNIAEYPERDRKTGLWLGELTHFLHELEGSGVEAVIASPKGGLCPIDPASVKSKDAINKTYLDRSELRDALKNTLSLEAVHSAEFDAIYLTGGHGVVWDFPQSPRLATLISEMEADGKIISAVCHGVSGLLNVVKPNGEPLIANKPITGFSNFEEKLVRLDRRMPYLLETELRKRGSRFEKAFLPFQSHVVSSGNLITGQNPASARKVASAVFAAVSAAGTQKE